MGVRNFTERDFAAVCRIYLEAKHDELRFEREQFDVVPLEEDLNILAAFRECDVRVFDDGEILGFIALKGNQLRALFVSRQARRQGVGQALLEAAASLAPDGVVLNVAKSNLDAQRFYIRNRFFAFGDVKRMYHGNTILYVQMKSA